MQCSLNSVLYIQYKPDQTKDSLGNGELMFSTNPNMIGHSGHECSFLVKHKNEKWFEMKPSHMPAGNTSWVSIKEKLNLKSSFRNKRGTPISIITAKTK